MSAVVGGATSARLAPLLKLLPPGRRKIYVAAITRSVNDAMQFAPKGRSPAAVLARWHRLYARLNSRPPKPHRTHP